MQRIHSLSTLIVILGILAAGCNLLQRTRLSQTPLPTSTRPFQPGDPTSIPPGSEITDPDFQAGVAAYKNKDFEQVQVSMEKVIRKDPQLAPPYWYLGRANYEKGDYEAALQQMEKALAIDPNYALAYADRGIINSALGNEDQAVDDLQHALELDPSLAKAHHNLGVHYYEQGQLDLALQEYDMAVQIDPTRSSTWNARAQVLGAMGNLGECIESASHAIENDPKNWSAYGTRAGCYASSGDEEHASTDIATAMQNDPQDAEVAGQVCAIMTNMRTYEQAIEYCTISIELEPDKYQSIINRGVIYFNKGDYLRAREDFSHALEFGDIPVAYSNRGNANLKLSEYQKAIDDYKKSLELYPSGYVYYSLGFAYSQNNDYENALSAFEQGDLLEPERASENYRLLGKARAYDRLGQTDKALELYTQLIDQYQRTEAYYFRARIYEAKDMKEDAIRDYQAFLDHASQMPNDVYVQMLAHDAGERLEKLEK